MARRSQMRKVRVLLAALVGSFGVGLGTGLYVDEPGAVWPGLGLGPGSGPAVGVTRPVEVIATTRFEVLRVVDGDTFVVPYDGEPTKVRILHVDTPERGERGYGEATEALEGMIGGRVVTLHFEADSKRDNFGRLLARVTVDGLDVGEELLRRRLAVRWGQ